ncbi:voltage-dependent anion-selective channel protein 2, partial [Eurytemora carolleeae]|uniref:voltage-dependent anion-selective channel protein 2 n=1 Tax=Eurytemora carolleeae TaxID=1294199 RepID=UPI000C77E319
MVPPLYADLGKQTRDVFGKGFHFGLVKLDVKTRTSSGLEFISSGISNKESGKVSGSFEGKYELKDYKALISTKWSTSNILASKFEFQDLLMNGLRITMDTTLNGNNNVKDGKV